MRTVLAYFFLMLGIATNAMALDLRQIPWGAKSEIELRQWAAKLQGSSFVDDYNLAGRRLMLIQQDVGSGLVRLTAFVYVKNQSEWRLLLVREKVDEALALSVAGGKQLELKSESGRIFATIPLETLVP